MTVRALMDVLAALCCFSMGQQMCTVLSDYSNSGISNTLKTPSVVEAQRSVQGLFERTEAIQFLPLARHWMLCILVAACTSLCTGLRLLAPDDPQPQAVLKSQLVCAEFHR